MALDVEKVQRILWWVAVAIFIFLAAWYAFGNSPGLEEVSFFFSLLFFMFAWDERKSRKETRNRLDNIHKVLININETLRRN